jgi:hypothetical protein
VLIMLVFFDVQSPPARGRGLKHFRQARKRRVEDVAPRAGAWIETGIVRNIHPVIDVAPRAGAWIETVALWQRLGCCLCRPPRGGVD